MVVLCLLIIPTIACILLSRLSSPFAAGLSLAQLRALFLRLSEQVFNEGLFGKWMQGVPNSLAIQGILQDVFKGRLMLDVKEPK